MKKNRLVALAALALSTVGLAACGGGETSSVAPTTSSTTSTEQATTSHITSKLEASYVTGEEVDLAPTLADGWTIKISIQQEGITIVKELQGTKYTFSQIGNYTIIYVATNGTATERLSVNITLTAPVGQTFLSFTGTTYKVDLYEGFKAEIKKVSDNSVVLETTFSYTRSNSFPSFQGSNVLPFTVGEDEVGPVVYIHYEGEFESGLPHVVRSKTVGENGDMVLELDFTSNGVEIKDTVTCSNADWKAKFTSEKVLTFNGLDSVFGPSKLDLYSDGLCSYSFLGQEVTSGRVKYGDNYVVYGGGGEGNSFGGGFWSMSGETVEDFSITINIDGVEYPVSMDATLSLNFTYVFSISAYKRNMNMTSLASEWEPALLGIAAVKVSFNGSQSQVICYDDEEHSVKVFKVDDTENAVATGTWAFNTISRKFTLVIGTTTYDVPMDEDGRLYLEDFSVAGTSISGDYLETSLNWADLFAAQGTKLIDGTGKATYNAVEYDVNFRLFDNNTFLVTAAIGTEEFIDTGTYSFYDNVYTFVGENGQYTSTFADGTYSVAYSFTFNNETINTTIEITPDMVLKATKTLSNGDYTYYLTTYKESGYTDPNYFTVYGFTASQKTAAHSDNGSFALNNGVYTFTSAKNGEFTSSGTGDALTVTYNYLNGQDTVTLTFAYPTAVVA